MSLIKIVALLNPGQDSGLEPAISGVGNASPPEVTLGALGTKWCSGRIYTVGGDAPLTRQPLSLYHIHPQTRMNR